MKKMIFTTKQLVEYPYLNFFSYVYKDGIHVFRYHRLGVQKNISSQNFEKAKIKVLEFCRLLKRQLDEPDICHVLFTDYAEKWLNVMKKPYIVAETYRVYMSVFKNYIYAAFENKYISDIDIFSLQKFFNDLPVEKGKTRENIKIILNGVFQFALNNGDIKINPMRNIKVKRHIRQKGKAFEYEDEVFFLQKIKGLNDELAYLIMLYSGVRPSELPTIVFDWEKNIMTIKNSKLKEWQTDEYRCVPIFPLLKDLRVRIETENWHTNMKRLSNRFSYRFPKYKLYDLRHTFISRAKELCDISDELVNLWTGHTLGDTVTAKVYTHYNMIFQQKKALELTYNIVEVYKNPPKL